MIRVRRSLLAALVGVPLLLAGTARAQTAAPATSASDAPFIETAGAADVRIAPDRATITLSVETRGLSAAAIAATNARAQRAVLDTLAALGLRGPAVSAQSFNVSPNYESDARGRRQAGYVVRNVIIVRLSDLARIGGVIDAALARGATGVGNLEFGSSGADSATHVATRRAIAKARAQAEAMADALGGSLGPLVQATTTPGDPRAFMNLRIAGGSVGNFETPIAPTDVVVVASVLTRWRFLPRR